MTGTVGAGSTYSDTAYTGGHSSGLIANTKRFALPVVAGDTVAASALVTKNASSSAVFVNVVWVTDGGAYISEVAGNGVTQSVSGDSGNPADYALSSLVAVAPANARFAIMYVRQSPVVGQVNPTAWFMSPLISRIQTGQTAVPPYTPGEVDRRANATAENQAATIAGQGAFATVSSVANGSAFLTGFGSLSSLAFTTFGTNVRRADGTTVVTDALAITSLGQAATIAGQGKFATQSSVAYGSAFLTGFGSLAPLGFTTFGTNVRRADGTTVVTDALAITSLGQAATIAGQGSFATLSSASRTGGLLTDFGSLAGLSNALGLTAGSITNQGWGATASEDQARASRDGLTLNPRFDQPFTGPGIPPGWSDWSNGAANTTYITKPIGDGKCIQINAGATVDGGIQQQVFVAPSQDYVLTGEIRRQSGTLAGAGVHINFYNASNNPIGPTNISFATEATTAGVTTSTPDGIQRWEKIVTAPAGATYALIYAMSHWSGFGGSIAVANSIAWYECSLQPLSLVRQLRADVTSGNQAASFSGQAALATLSFVQLSSNVRLADGTTIATNALLVTSQGQAASFTGQGALATKNQAADGDFNVSSLSAISANLGNITSGAIDLTANSYVVRHGAGFGASSDLVMWYGLASIARSSATKTNGVFTLATDGKVYFGASELTSSSPLNATMTEDYLAYHNTTINPTLQNLTASVSNITNGTAPYSYLWAFEVLEEGIGEPTLSGTTTSTCTINKSGALGANQSYIGFVSCTITDANSKQVTKYFKFSRISNSQ